MKQDETFTNLVLSLIFCSFKDILRDIIDLWSNQGDCAWEIKVLTMWMLWSRGQTAEMKGMWEPDSFTSKDSFGNMDVFRWKKS